VCDEAPSGAPLFHQRFARIEGVSVLDGYTVVRCHACGMAFADGLPPQADFDRYYREASKYEGVDTEGRVGALDARRMDVAADHLDALLPARDTAVLEVGCATGYLLGRLKARGFVNLLGVDPSPRCADVGSAVHGLTIRSGSLFDDSLPAGPFDAVILLEVLEHVVDVAACIDRLVRRLAPGGVLYLEVPDASAFDPTDDAPFQQCSVEHINFFTPDDLARLGARFGLSARGTFPLRMPRPGGGEVAIVAMALVRAETVPSTLPLPPARHPMEGYLSACAAREFMLLAGLRRALRTAPRWLIWGCGTLTLRLLALGAIPPERVVGFVDGNPRYRGHTLLGHTIQAPSDLAPDEVPILIGSVGQTGPILSAIRARFGPGRRVVTLLEADEAARLA